MIKGDKIKLVKPMGAFTNVGEICEVTNVDENGVISFRFGGYHLGCMSYNEFETYFELMPKPVKRKWTEWKEAKMTVQKVTDTSFAESEIITIAVRHNVKTVQLRYEDKNTGVVIKASSTCHNDDTFSITKGYTIAEMRLFAKYYAFSVEQYIKKQY